jgi:hypothetical protein
MQTLIYLFGRISFQAPFLCRTETRTGKCPSLKSKQVMKPCQTLYKESTQERERKRNKGQGPKSRQANSPKEAGHKEEGNH